MPIATVLAWMAYIPQVLPLIWQSVQAVEALIATVKATTSAKDAAVLEGLVRDIGTRLAAENALVQAQPLP